jgi:hypothetical protein
MGDNYINFLDLAGRVNTKIRHKRIAVTSTGVELIHTATTAKSSIKRVKVMLQAAAAIPVYINFDAAASSTAHFSIVRNDGLVEFEMNPANPVRIYAKSTAATSINLLETWAST